MPVSQLALLSHAALEVFCDHKENASRERENDDLLRGEPSVILELINGVSESPS